MRKWIKLSVSLFFSLFLLLFLVTTFYIEYQVQDTCRKAVKNFPGNKIQALINVVKNQSLCNEDKSKALWAMGQLGDKKALPYLIKNFADLDETDICIYEAKFAIEKITNESFNLPGFIWRSILES